MAGSRDQFVADVVANIPLCREHFRLVLRLPAFPPTDPGQFIQLCCRDLELDQQADTREREIDWQPGQPIQNFDRELISPLAMLRRPFSLAGRRDTLAGVELDIIHRVVGVGTDWLSRLSPGDKCHLLGPLGNRFQLPPKESTAILVGGGVGIPPMIYLAERLAGRKAIVFSGALSRNLLPLTITGETRSQADDISPKLNVTEFARHNIPTVLCTDDGSQGFRGFVTQALEKWLDAWEQGQGAGGSKGQGKKKEETPSLAMTSLAPRPSPLAPLTLYTCGPEPMMKRVAAIANSRGIECQIAVERAMACGMGTCQSCVIRVKKPDASKPPLVGKNWCYRLACTDGPVFYASQLLW